MIPLKTHIAGDKEIISAERATRRERHVLGPNLFACQTDLRVAIS